MLDPALNHHEDCNGTMVLPFSERILLAERIIYVIVASLLAWFVFEVSKRYLFHFSNFWQGTVSVAVCLFV